VKEDHEAITTQLKKLKEGLRRTIDQIPSSATECLRQDDYQLQKLTALSALDADDGKELRTKVAQLTAKLTDMKREEIECRLDRVYLGRLAQEDGDRHQEQNKLEEQEEQLEQDLNSLHVEIPDVAAILVSQEFEAPLLRALSKKQNEENNRTRMVLEDVGFPNLVQLTRCRADEHRSGLT
jgi:hypothetical protein